MFFTCSGTNMENIDDDDALDTVSLVNVYLLCKLTCIISNHCILGLAFQFCLHSCLYSQSQTTCSCKFTWTCIWFLRLWYRCLDYKFLFFNHKNQLVTAYIYIYIWSVFFCLFCFVFKSSDGDMKLFMFTCVLWIKHKYFD